MNYAEKYKDLVQQTSKVWHDWTREIAKKVLDRYPDAKVLHNGDVEVYTTPRIGFYPFIKMEVNDFHLYVYNPVKEQHTASFMLWMPDPDKLNVDEVVQSLIDTVKKENKKDIIKVNQDTPTDKRLLQLKKLLRWDKVDIYNYFPKNKVQHVKYSLVQTDYLICIDTNSHNNILTLSVGKDPLNAKYSDKTRSEGIRTYGHFEHITKEIADPLKWDIEKDIQALKQEVDNWIFRNRNNDTGI